MDTELADFLHCCRVERRLAELTCTAYERDVRACMRFLQGEGVTAWQAVGPPHLRRFLADEVLRRPAPSSKARTVAALKCFFRFCLENEYLERDPELVLRTAKKREALPDVLDQREVARLLRVIDREDEWKRRFSGRREQDKLMLAVFAFAGLRHNELLCLDWDDVDFERRLLHVRKAKGGSQRKVPIHPALVPLFLDYLTIRGVDPEPALFVGVQGGRLNSTQLKHVFRRYVDAAGVGERKHVTPHMLRHVFASEPLDAGGEPAPDPGATRAQASRLDAALRARHRARPARRRQEASLPERGCSMTRMLAPLKVGDKLPWRLGADGEPRWLTVIEVVSDVSYLVRYPDGAIELLVDSE